MFYVLCADNAQRERLIGHLEARGILAVFHYLPLHVSAMGKRFGGRVGQCPVTEDVSARLLRLPFYNGLSAGEQGEVIAALNDFAG
jgi:dTDP-4-amino-4,6-dideoxygalactose transaminase